MLVGRIFTGAEADAWGMLNRLVRGVRADGRGAVELARS